jgi:uncharacterized protein
MFFAHADPALRQLAQQWKQEQKDIHEFRETGGTYNAFRDFMG